MKTKQQKYDEACERNVRKSLSKEKYNVQKNATPEDRADGALYVKQCLGIRASDSRYDTEINKRING